ncbi:putative mitochondrial carrier protein [Rosellinia necatrix]|uniref:Putative mitochondrial carrier protein n=1 Tax=Rosellinia necatrix TaxID=77044 RepID=A0A1S7UP12_ROSNE|nr:putative mitochondrial carrier protein [Rosellinia necatrix]
MSADFWAGYVSGVAAILIGNPMDRIKVRLQAYSPPQQPLPTPPTLSSCPQPSLSSPTLPPSAPALAIPLSPTSLSSLVTRYLQSTAPLVAGTAAPILGYGALNALLFVSYNRTEDALNRAFLIPTSLDVTPDVINNTRGSNLWTTWLAGAAGGLATWPISTPTELIKCRAQLASLPGSSPTGPSSSFCIARSVLRTEGVRGLYHGGVVTALRDAIGYGFYFWAYELSGRVMTSLLRHEPRRGPSSLDIDGVRGNGNAMGLFTQETAKVLLCGGIAGVATWASIFPLDVIKTRVQAQAYPSDPAATPLLASGAPPRRRGTVRIAREAYAEGGAGVFFRGLLVCSVRAFLVNAVQWFCYEWIMLELGRHSQDREKQSHS